MNRRSTSLTDRDGVHLVGRTVTRDLGWLFREQAVADQGVDAQVEIAVDGHATGRLVALQIKTGATYFRPAKGGGWTFYYTERERNLWNGHALPVMVVLVDTDNDTAYWQRISPATERRTKQRFAVTVPECQTLSTASAAWELAASGLEPIAHERWEAHLDVLPPQAASVLRSKEGANVQRELIALHLAEGRLDAAGTARRLFAEQPVWMQSDDGWPWVVLGNFCARHQEMIESSQAFEIAAEFGGATAGKRLGVAALHAVSSPARARELIERANGYEEARVPVAIAEAILEHPVGDARPMRIDGVIEVAGVTIDDDATAQTFLAEQALRARDALGASRHAERALDLAPEDTEAMIRLASICLRRSATLEAQSDDVPRAVTLLSAAVEQLRRWSGRSDVALELLAKAFIVAGQHDQALRWLLPEPHGTATARESQDPDLLRLALAAAHFAGSELEGWILGQMRDDERDLFTKVRLGIVQRPDDELRSLWSAELNRAEAEDDLGALTDAVLRLAQLGIDESAQFLPLVARGVLPTGAERLPAAIARLHHDTGDGLERLRVLAAEEAPAAQQHIVALVELGRVLEAATACELAFERFREPSFRTDRAKLLSRAGDPRAIAALQEALQVSSDPDERLMLATRMAAIRADAGDPAGAEQLLTEALSRFDEPPAEAVWNVVRVQLAQAAGPRAAATISRHKPAVRLAEEAALWLRAMATVPWDSILASKAIALAGQFQDEPRLAASLLSHVVTATRGVGTPAGADSDLDVEFADKPVDDRPTVAGELHKRAFEALNQLIETHGDLTGARVFKADSPEESIEQIIDFLRESAPPDLSELLDLIARARVPAGMIAVALGKTYTHVLVHRAAGQLVSVPLDDDESDLDVAAARVARGSVVVVDLSTLLVLGVLDNADALLGQYGSLLLPREAKEDVVRAVVDVQGLAASPASLGWDSAAGRPWMREQTDAQYRLLRERTAMIEQLVRRASVRNQRSAVFPDEVSSGIAQSPWVAAVELAAHEGVALWCDDLSVRRLARSVGVATFSTMAVVEVMTEIQLTDVTPSETVDEIALMRECVAARMLAEHVVDVPVTTEQVTEQARSESWSPYGAAALALSRPGWWCWHSDPIADLRRLYDAVREHNPESLQHWQYAAMLGAVRGLPGDSGARVLCALALLGWDHDITGEPDFDVLVTGCRNARRAAGALQGTADPLLAIPAMVATLRSMGVERSETTMQALLGALGSGASDD